MGARSRTTLVQGCRDQAFQAQGWQRAAVGRVPNLRYVLPEEQVAGCQGRQSDTDSHPSELQRTCYWQVLALEVCGITAYPLAPPGPPTCAHALTDNELPAEPFSVRRVSYRNQERARFRNESTEKGETGPQRV